MDKNFYQNLSAALRNASGAADKPKEKAEEPKATKPKSASNANAKAAPKSDTPKQKSFLHLFNDYLRSALKQALDERAASDEVLAKKMQAKGKSFEGCMNYIGEHFYQLALKQRNGQSCVSFGGSDEELVGLAIHYYDESEESLKEELKSK